MLSLVGVAVVGSAVVVLEDLEQEQGLVLLLARLTPLQLVEAVRYPQVAQKEVLAEILCFLPLHQTVVVVEVVLATQTKTAITEVLEVAVEPHRLHRLQVELAALEIRLIHRLRKEIMGEQEEQAGTLEAVEVVLEQ